MFRYAALIYLIGAVLFVLFVGLVLLPIAFALQAVAFYILPETIEAVQEEYYEQADEAMLREGELQEGSET